MKQFQFNPHPKFIEYDIFALFNEYVPFWFEGDPKIRSDQYDFRPVIVHELIHGLGFSNAYNRYHDYDAIIPFHYKPEDNSINVFNGSYEDGEFVEFMMDKYTVLLEDGTPISYYIQQLNSYFAMANTTNIDTLDFINSPQFKIAEELYTLSTTPLTIGVLPKGAIDYTCAIPLETSLPTFKQGSTLSHVDLDTYDGTSDFLMVYNASSWIGLTAQDLVGNYSGGLIGPNLKLVLENYGYVLI